MTLQSHINCIYILKNMFCAQLFMIFIICAQLFIIFIRIYIIICLIVMTAYVYGWPLSWPFCPYMALELNQEVLHKYHHARS